MTIKLTGEVVRPGDSGYEAARIGWNRLYSRFPQAIVFCSVAQDVVHAVEWAREEGIALRARSGRHSLDGGPRSTAVSLWTSAG
jgi:FAD/FMN-containing dehydrogenase